VNLDLQDLFDAEGAYAPPPALDRVEVMRRGRALRRRRHVLAGGAALAGVAIVTAGSLVILGPRPQSGPPVGPSSSSPSPTSTVDAMTANLNAIPDPARDWLPGRAYPFCRSDGSCTDAHRTWRAPAGLTDADACGVIAPWARTVSPTAPITVDACNAALAAPHRDYDVTLNTDLYLDSTSFRQDLHVERNPNGTLDATLYDRNYTFIPLGP